MADPAPVRWTADAVPPADPAPDRPSMAAALGRGLRGACPTCGRGRIFARYLKVVDRCVHCGEALGQIRADDAPPYFTIFAVGHVVVPGMLILEQAATPPLWVHSAIWLPLTVVLALALIQPLKGATIGAMLRLGIARPDSHA